ncbi:two-component sensor histidine kinase [Rhizobium azibense]|nr:two-component sensor histidine kinase [Rhizobium azibense]
MNDYSDRSGIVEQVLDLPNLADTLEAEQFRLFLDHLPFGVAVSSLHPDEVILYVNAEFERLTGLTSSDVQDKTWTALSGHRTDRKNGGGELCDAIVAKEEYLGTFTLKVDHSPSMVDVWSNTILNDEGEPAFRLVALSGINQARQSEREDFERKIQEKDMLLRELQHRVKNNLQMITALIRLEARNLNDAPTTAHFDRLAGRVEALALLYRSLSQTEIGETVDLGVYLSQVATAVMNAHAVEGIRFELKVDTWPVSINVAMPTGLVVNELLTNALKHAFVGRDHGRISLVGLVDDTGWHITVSDDGIGLQPGTEWPKRGKLSALIMQSLRENAKAQLDVQSAPGAGTRVKLLFPRDKASEAR